MPAVRAAPGGWRPCSRSRSSLPGAAAASRSQWSMVEDHPYLVRSGPDVRERDAERDQGAGRRRAADRGQVERGRSGSGARTRSRRSTPPTRAPTPASSPTTTSCERATAKGFRVHDHARPRRAATGRPSGGRGGNYKVDSRDFADFARAVGKRYSGVYSGLPKVTYWSIWNEPNHIFFIKPRSQAPRVYRRLVRARRAGAEGRGARRSRCSSGELAPVGTATKVIGPLRFLQQWLCVDKQLQAPARPDGARGRLQRLQARHRQRVRAPSLRPGGHGLPRSATS